MNFYNENEPYAVEWLQNLERAGHIATGAIDPRSIQELAASDLAGRQQAHFFAGLGGWSYALRLAGWPDDEPVWTGSCPCQPFSQSGRRKGFTDERHLWPVWFELIRQCRPPVVFGEQVASPDGLRWLDIVYADLEGAGYAVGASDLCAAGVGAPHIRQRLYFVAYSSKVGRGQGRPHVGGVSERGSARDPRTRSEHTREPFFVGDPSGKGPSLGQRSENGRGAVRHEGQAVAAPSAWGNCEWVDCQDGKRRPVEPGTFPLAHGVPARVGKLRAYGNAIVPQVAATFIRSVRWALTG